MRILVDECVHAGVKAAFRGHSVQTVSGMGWRSSKDDWLLRAAQERFDVFVTIDQNLPRQFALAKFRLGFVIARVPRNEIKSYAPLFDELLLAAESVRPGQVMFVGNAPPRR